MNDTEKIFRYLADRECGLSARAIIYRMNNIEKVYNNHPLDSSDFGRCMRLLSVFPEYRGKLHLMRSVSKEWSLLVDHWVELEKLYATDGLDKSLYEKMKSLFGSIPCNYCKEPIGSGGFIRIKDARFHLQCKPAYHESE